ncbi:MAG: hypothetical protein H6Q41_2070 [Deltaproteobacteria bacterium]|jgi:hypothetical protein|nr:hypothetical protein [Deltaproteobacteria bacterium]
MVQRLRSKAFSPVCLSLFLNFRHLSSLRHNLQGERGGGGKKYWKDNETGGLFEKMVLND